MTAKKPSGWHVARWSPLAWLETILKLAAIGIALGTFTEQLATLDLALPAGSRLLQLIILAALSLGLLLAIGDRLRDREIVAMLFVLLNNLGHWSMVLLLAGAGAVPLLTFLLLMLAGDVVKLIFIRVDDFTVRDYPQRLLYILTGIYIAGYALVLLLEFFQ